MAGLGHPRREWRDDRQGGWRAHPHAQDQGLPRGGAARATEISQPARQSRGSARIVSVADAGWPRRLRRACPERARIHEPARRSGHARRSSRLRSRHEAIDQTFGRARRRDRQRQNLKNAPRPTLTLQGRQGGDVKLYTYFRSSAAYRVRIALNLKGLSSETISIHLQKQGGLNKRPEYRAVNPQMRVPALQLDSGEVLIQSLA